MDVTAEDILQILCDYLRTALEQGIIKLVSTGKGQARNDSAANELLIGNSLRGFALGHPLFTHHGMSFEMATNGDWYDFLIRSADDSIWLPVNLKVSSLKGRDNLSSKAGVFFALTGLRPTGAMIANWDVFARNLAARVKRQDCKADYYYLVVQKSTPEEPIGTVFWTSLLQLHHVSPNGSNPPFQCKWLENAVRVVRDRADAVDRILDVLGETFVLRAKALESFKKHIVPSFEGTLREKWSGDTPQVEGDAG